MCRNALCGTPCFFQNAFARLVVAAAAAMSGVFQRATTVTVTKNEIFESWNQGELKSYLIEITAEILRKKDEVTGLPLIDVILDKAGNKGTGKWTSIQAIDNGINSSIITESLFARYISSIKEERIILGHFKK